MTTCGGLVPVTPITVPFARASEYWSVASVVVVADRREPHESLVLDVLDDEAELVHVGAEHQTGAPSGPFFVK